MEQEKIVIEQPPIKPGEVFDAENEIKGILKVSKEERKQKLAEFKEKLKYQQTGLVKVQSDIISKIKEDPEIPFNEIFEEACHLGEEYGMNETQRETIRKALEKYDICHRSVEEAVESSMDDADLYKNLFGKKPKGEVSVVTGPVTLYLKCYSLEDYENIYFKIAQKIDPKRKFDDEFKKHVDRTKGIQVSGMDAFPDLWIAVENVTKVSEDENPEKESENVFVHEEQHAIKSLFEEPYERNRGLANQVRTDFKSASGLEEKEQVLRRYFRETRKEPEIYAKDEILAYYKDGTPFEDIVEKLSKLKEEEGNYDYSEKDRNNLFLWMGETEETKKLSQELAQDVYIKEYRELLEASVGAIKKMEEAGYDKEEIIALLTHEPLARWRKVVGRVLENT